MSSKFGYQDVRDYQARNKLVSTFELAARKARRCGNTTRQVDFAVQELFDDKAVLVRDHSQSPVASKRLCIAIVHRIEKEHYFKVEMYEHKNTEGLPEGIYIRLLKD